MFTAFSFKESTDGVISSAVTSEGSSEGQRLQATTGMAGTASAEREEAIRSRVEQLMR